MSVLDQARVLWREHKERVAEKKAAEKVTPRTHDSRFWLLSLPGTMILFAGCVEVVWAFLFCVEATGRAALHVEWAAGSMLPTVTRWNVEFTSDLLLLLALMAATVPIVIWSMVWLPVQMKARGQGKWRRITMIGAGLICNALVIVSGTVVMNQNRQEQVRAGLVTEQSADQQRAAVVARRDAIHDRWATLTASSNTTLQAQAARAGVAGWNAYVTTARQQATQGTITPSRLALIERASGSAVAAEQYQHDMDNLTGQIAATAPAAASAAHVQDDVGAPMDSFAEHVKVYRPPFVALSCTILGIFGAWWLIGLIEAMNSHNIASSGWADEGHRIEDHSDEDSLTVDPAGMRPAKQRFTDADTGEEIERTVVKQHFRERKLKKGKPQKVEIPADIPLDEVGVPTGTGDERGTSVSLATHDQKDAIDQQKTAADDLDQSTEKHPVITEHPINHPEPPAAEAALAPAVAEATEEEIASLTADERPEDSVTPEVAQDAASSQRDQRDYPRDDSIDHEPTSTALTPPGYVFEEEQHDAHVRARELEGAES